MKTKSRTRVIVETHQLTIIRTHRRSVRTWCQLCVEEVEMITPEEAALQLHLTPRIIFRKIESGELHYVETEKGLLFICCNSLRAKDSLRSV